MMAAVRPDLKADIRENVLLTMTDATAIVLGAFVERELIGIAVGRLHQSFTFQRLLVSDLTVCDVSWSEEVKGSMLAWYAMNYERYEIISVTEVVKAPHLAEVVSFVPGAEEESA